jgi:hypothetical protein
MAKRPTPIERAISGEPQSRQARYLRRLDSKGLRRVMVVVPSGRADDLRALARSWCEEFERDD